MNFSRPSTSHGRLRNFPAVSREAHVDLYRTMVRTRAFEETAHRYQIASNREPEGKADP